MTPRSLSLKGCTMAEAEERMRAFLEDIAIEAMGTFPPDVLADIINDVVARNVAAVDEAMQEFRTFASELQGGRLNTR
jgi:hypothetical protein